MLACSSPLPTSNFQERSKSISSILLRSNVRNQKNQNSFINSATKTILQFIALIAMSSVYITHGGGPMPILREDQHKQMYKQFKAIHDKYPNPKAIILFSAHWEEKDWTIIDYDSPPLYYDYGGFPPQTYNLSFKMTSNAQIRNHVKQHLSKQGINLKTNTKRGYDHGVFIPLMIMYPESKVPVIQVSLLESLDPEPHFMMGVALRELKKEGFLILGSGASCHGGFGQKASIAMSQAFDQELRKQIQKAENDYQLLQVAKGWRSLPHAKYLHPREQHLAPLFVNLGVCEGKRKENLKLFLMGLHFSNYILQ